MYTSESQMSEFTFFFFSNHKIQCFSCRGKKNASPDRSTVRNVQRPSAACWGWRDQSSSSTLPLVTQQMPALASWQTSEWQRNIGAHPLQCRTPSNITTLTTHGRSPSTGRDAGLSARPRSVPCCTDRPWGTDYMRFDIPCYTEHTLPRQLTEHGAKHFWFVQKASLKPETKE